MRPKSAMLPEKDRSLSELLSQVDSGISRSFDRVKENSCHSKENTCKRLSGISSADSAFSSQDSITLSFEKENSCGENWFKTLKRNFAVSGILLVSFMELCSGAFWGFDPKLFLSSAQTLQRCRSVNSVTPSGPKTLPS